MMAKIAINPFEINLHHKVRILSEVTVNHSLISSSLQLHVIAAGGKKKERKHFQTYEEKTNLK